MDRPEGVEMAVSLKFHRHRWTAWEKKTPPYVDPYIVRECLVCQKRERFDEIPRP